MKKLFLAISIILLMTLNVYSETLDSGNWYQYNGYSASHSFSVKFPTDWEARTSGDDFQGFAPKNMKENTYFNIREFEGQTYDQVIQYYLNENTDLIEVKDFVFSNGGDLIAKRAVYQILDNQFAMTFIKRGSLITALTEPNLENEEDFPIPGKYNDIVEAVYKSFAFTDGWHQYIDFGEKYAFIFPSSLGVANLSDGVSLTDPAHFNNIIFSVFKYRNTSIENAPEEAEGYGEKLEEENAILFHGIKNAVSAVYYDSEYKKNFSRIFVENNGNSYSLTDVNIENNFPHLNYYDDYIIEMLESFEFFDVEGEYQSYIYFPDVRGDHPNKDAINYLTEADVIAGYPDGKFRPDGEINRAELTKMIVAAKITPDTASYGNCFPDVKEDWYAPFVCYAKERGWVQGYPDGKFRPEKNINRVETLKIIFEVLFDELDEDEELENTSVADIDTSAWYAKYFIFADNRDLLDKQHILEEGDQYYYYPGENITRKEVAEIIYKSLKVM